MLGDHGARVLDADAIAKAVVEPGRPTLGDLVERFGAGVLGPDGALDRAALASVAFADDESRRALERITHPAIAQEMRDRIDVQPADAVVVFEVQLLVETWEHRIRDYDAVVVVEAPEALRLERAVARGMSREDAERRLAAQATDAQRREVATYVITNAGDLDELARAVDALWSDLVTLRDRKAPE
jgi:dephospho-CoA kinase